MQKHEVLWNDTYQGSRYTYALLLRPMSLFNLPSAYTGQVIAGSHRAYPGYLHGVFDLAVRLPDDVAELFDLKLISES